MFASPGSIAFQLGPFVVRWYGILTAVAIVTGLLMARVLVPRRRWFK